MLLYHSLCLAIAAAPTEIYTLSLHDALPISRRIQNVVSSSDAFCDRVVAGNWATSNGAEDSGATVAGGEIRNIGPPGWVPSGHSVRCMCGVFSGVQLHWRTDLEVYLPLRLAEMARRRFVASAR